jgi:hypothetical protein
MESITEQPHVVWAPLPGSQSLALSCPAHHILYEGSRGPGKTDAQLMFFRKLVGVGYGAFWRGIIFDREYKNLDDLIAKSLRWFSAFRDGARFLRSKSDYKWVWPTGEELYFRQIKRKEDYWNYHGQEFTYIGWNELCKYPSPELFEALMSCNRSSFLPLEHSPDLNNPLPPIPLVVFCTANPYGPGHAWVKKRFIDPAQPGEIQRQEIEVFNPQTQQREPVVKTQVRIFGSYRENRFLSPDYVAELEKVRDPNKRKAWLAGDWNIVAGGAIDDLWNETIHIVPRFKVPLGWRIDRAFDWGSSKPFSVGWWCLANGEEAALPDGSTFCPPKGSLIRLAEWYGANPNETNVGLSLSSKSIAQGIRFVEEKLRASGWIEGTIYPGPADNSIFNETRNDNGDLDSIAKSMQKEGVTWEGSNKSPGSRKLGFQLVRDRLENSLTGEGPALYFMAHCRAAITQLPVLPRDPDEPDDVDTEAEDHLWDELRYRVLKGAGYAATYIPVQHPT